MTLSYIIDHTFKGITLEFYLEHLRKTCIIPIFFLVMPLVLSAFAYFMSHLSLPPIPDFDEIPVNVIKIFVYIGGSWLLYPYSRCAYFLIFDSIPPLKFLEALVTLLTLGLFALASALFCFAFAFIGGPLGLILLFFKTRQIEKHQLMDQIAHRFEEEVAPPLPTVDEEVAKWSALYREGKISKEEYFKIAGSLRGIKDKDQ